MRPEYEGNPLDGSVFPVDTPLVLRLDKDAYGKKPFFSWTEVLFNHAVKLHDYWFVQW